jgi:hypothetical protein
MLLKMKYQEHSLLYSASLQRRNGPQQESNDTLRPYMETCCTLIETESPRLFTGLRYLALILIALGRQDEALALARTLYASNGWLCDGCRIRVYVPQPTAICTYCFDGFCGICKKLINEPAYTRHCVPSHCFMDINSDVGSNLHHIRFRDGDTTLNDLIDILKNELGLKQE